MCNLKPWSKFDMAIALCYAGAHTRPLWSRSKIRILQIQFLLPIWSTPLWTCLKLDAFCNFHVVTMWVLHRTWKQLWYKKHTIDLQDAATARAQKLRKLYTCNRQHTHKSRSHVVQCHTQCGLRSPSWAQSIWICTLWKKHHTHITTVLLNWDHKELSIFYKAAIETRTI